jgi:ABC-2 type transport system permease protein
MSRPGVLVAYRWELRKLAAQKRTYLGLAGMAGMPLLFTLIVALQGGTVDDGLLGRYVRDTGLATPLILLFFGSVFLFPLAIALVAGDIVASEDAHGTLKTILTRSVDRGAVFAAKALAAATYALAALAVFAVVAVAVGVAAWGAHPLTSLSGTEVPVGRALGLIAAALAFYGLPLLAVASVAVLFSTLSRNSAGAVVGTLLVVVVMQIVMSIPGTDAIEPYLVTGQFDAWQGVLRDPIDWAPVARAAWVSALYALPCLIGAAAVFRARDVAGG